MSLYKSVLLVNLGSPEKPETGSIRAYLKQFLSDPRVMDMPAAIRWLILYLFILPFRPAAILPKYAKIYEKEGFLLIRHSRDLVDALSQKLGPEYKVELAMRYGKPSLREALQRIEQTGISDLLVIPLFPQYASATTGSILEAFFETIKSWTVFPRIQVLPQFYERTGFISAWASRAESYLRENPDHILFSFHGLPESHLLKADHSETHCLTSQVCCDKLDSRNHACYRAQCFQTARSIADALGIHQSDYSVGFQSRLGRAKWIGPYTSEIISRLGEEGVRHLLVFCPSFTVDCLETVEEIQVEERDRFLKHGGQRLTLVPSLNSEKAWVDALAHIIEREME
ncbi:ferrochelatase [bacterium]|nr:ferrochelatase [bacterium]